jgi:hypothetical protein
MGSSTIGRTTSGTEFVLIGGSIGFVEAGVGVTVAVDVADKFDGVVINGDWTGIEVIPFVIVADADD